jgi:hypothetical protein
MGADSSLFSVSLKTGLELLSNNGTVKTLETLRDGLTAVCIVKLKFMGGMLWTPTPYVLKTWSPVQQHAEVRPLGGDRMMRALTL